MATTYVESATLELIDKSSAQAKKINASLKALDKTAQQLSKTLANLGKGGSALGKATRDANALAKALQKAANVKINPKVNLGAAQRSLNGLKAKNLSITVTANTSLARTSIAALGRRPVAVPVTLQQPRNMRPIRVQVDHRALRSAFADIGREIGRSIYENIKQAIRDGYTSADTSRSKVNSQQNTPAQNDAMYQGVTRYLEGERANSTQGTGLSRVEAEKVMAETSPAVRGDPAAVAAILKEVAAAIKLQVQLGQNRKDAVDSAFEFIKAAEASNNFKDKDGNFDAGKFSTFMETLRDAAPDIAQEFTGRFVRQAIKYLRGSKAGIGGEQLLTTLYGNEESGSTYSVGLNQLTKMLGGDQQSKKSLAFLSSLGLQTTKEIKVGKTGGKVTTELVAGDLEDEALMRDNMLRWVKEVMLPKAKAKGYDLNNKDDIRKFIGGMGGTATAQDVAGQIIGRMMDLIQAAENAARRDSSPENIDKISGESGMLALTNAGAQVDSLFGKIAQSANDALIPALNIVSGIMQDIGEFVTDPTTGKPDMVKGGAVAGGGLLGGIAALWGGSKLLGAFTGLTGNTTATWANTGALEANTAALLGAGAADAVGGNKGGRRPPGSNSSWLGLLALAGKLGAIWTGASSVQVESRDSPQGQKIQQFIDQIARDRKEGKESGLDMIEKLMLKLGVKNSFDGWGLSGKAKEEGDRRRTMEDFTNPRSAKSYNDEYATSTAWMRDPGAFDAGATQIKSAFETGGSDAQGKIAAGVSEASGLISSAITAGGQGAANLIAAAIRSAAQGIKINATVSGPAALPDTGANTVAK